VQHAQEAACSVALLQQQHGRQLETGRFKERSTSLVLTLFTMAPGPMFGLCKMARWCSFDHTWRVQQIGLGGAARCGRYEMGNHKHHFCSLGRSCSDAKVLHVREPRRRLQPRQVLGDGGGTLAELKMKKSC
jgi:hypothetical protein